MSFISVVKKILGVEHAVAPLLGAFVPGIAIFDSIVTRVQNAIGTFEVNIPKDGSGAIRSEAVVNDFEASLEVTKAIAAAEGKKLVYDDAALQRGINAQVTAYNEFAAVKASFKFVPA